MAKGVYQYNLTREIIVDNFAGGGGASTGIELALGRPVDIAINHDPAAIAMHKANHPLTEHLQASVWDVDPVKVCRGRPVALAWFSPDCKHFSKAKGAALVDKNIRGLAWIVLRWAGRVRPNVIILENVEEFVTWGPVRKGKPIKTRAGETFRKWEYQLKSLGYTVEHRELLACDYGAPTSRKRFYLIARCDGLPTVWPSKTHGKPDEPEVMDGKLKPWRTAAEIIDWSLPCPSIFATKAEIKEMYGVNAVRPLCPNTMRRIARGIDKFTIKSGKPFVIQQKFDNAPQDAQKPLGTLTAVGAHEVVSPLLIQYHGEQSENVRGQKMTEPIMTVDASNRYGLSTAHLSEWYGRAQDGLNLKAPLHTVTIKDREALTIAHIQKYYDGAYKGCGSAPNEPLGTITAIDHNAITLAHIAEFKGQDKGQPADVPLRTLTATMGEFGIVHTSVEKYVPGTDMKHWPKIRAMLNEYCEYHLADDEVLLLNICDTLYFIFDIGLRMLTPREAFNAQGFLQDYIIDVDDQGRPYPKSGQMARCGNAVCPPVAAALVTANLPEMAARWRFETMDDLTNYMIG